MFWLLAAWIIVVGLSSLIPQIFGPSAGAAPTGTSCGAELQDLTRELLEVAGDWLKSAPERGTRDTLDGYFADFDRRLMQTKLSCTESERPAFVELSRLRHGVGAELERFDREEQPHVQKLRAFFRQGGAATR